MYHYSGKAEIQKLIARHLFKCFKIKKEKEGKKGNNICIYIELFGKRRCTSWYKTPKKYCLFLSSTAMYVCIRFGMAL